MDAYIGEIRIFGANFAPVGWAFCNGQILPIAQNTALFSLLGTSFGGNGQTTFALPDLQGLVAMDQGKGPGLTSRVMGEVGGEETVTLAPKEMPLHTHTLMASKDPADHRPPGPTESFAASNPGTIYQSNTGSNLTTLASEALQAVGSGGPHVNEQPYLVLNYIIALEGEFPKRP